MNKLEVAVRQHLAHHAYVIDAVAATASGKENKVANTKASTRNGHSLMILFTRRAGQGYVKTAIDIAGEA